MYYKIECWFFMFEFGTFVVMLIATIIAGGFIVETFQKKKYEIVP